MENSLPNAFEGGHRKIIPAVLLYAFTEHPKQGKSVLMVLRNKKANDIHQGKWNGLGGKLELNETPEQAAEREFLEESGIHVLSEQWLWRGQLIFPNFKPTPKLPPAEDWWVNVFSTELEPSLALKAEATFSSPEGTLKWIPVNEVLALNLWQGDQKFLPELLSGKFFQGTFFYQDGNLSNFQLKLIEPKVI